MCIEDHKEPAHLKYDLTEKRTCWIGTGLATAKLYQNPVVHMILGFQFKGYYCESLENYQEVWIFLLILNICSATSFEKIKLSSLFVVVITVWGRILLHTIALWIPFFGGGALECCDYSCVTPGPTKTNHIVYLSFLVMVRKSMCVVINVWWGSEIKCTGFLDLG